MAIYFFQTRLEKQALTISPDEVNRNFVLAKTDVPLRLRILDHTAKTETVLEKEGDRWMLTAPVRYPADGRIVGGLVMALRMASERPRLRAAKEWDEYGLAKPGLEMVVEMPGKKAETLKLGAKTPIGNGVYARWDSERGYFLLQGEMGSALRPSAYLLREKRVFRAPPETIHKVSVEMGPNTWQWKKDTGGEWYWMEPIAKLGQKMPAESMGKVLVALQNFYIKEFLDGEKRSQAELGFFIIHDRIWIEPDLGKTEFFHFGNEVSEQNAYYGLREGEKPAFLIDRMKVIQFLDLLKAVEKDVEGRGAKVNKPDTLSSAPSQPIP